ncbi:membrane protein [Planomonospora parontospora subsp. parontospora]|uniref:Membrane protein n=2 Tax=Planomonospora parontospora TaxID=58119 RepID=A0AA37F513_9ACTN|nr:helix-turn-helix domain-containing protein [Planomonospora parontospora]GGK72500.1 membrane protein [Planomonospora parontospora]GII09292.1 membrane protein [Planomonospora parontospora subsp. parontospora]
MSIGEVLAQARQSAGLTVEQLSARACIRATLIHAIERDDFSLCGGDFYARGHVRNLARILGLDAEALVHEFDELHGGVPLPVRAASVFQADRPIKIRERRSPNWTLAMAVALTVVVVFGVVRTMGGAGDTPTDTRPVAAPSLPTLPPPSAPPAPGAPAVPGAPSASSAAVDPAHGAASVRRGEEVVLKVRAERSSRLSVKDAKGRRLFSGTLKAGKTAQWKAKGGMKVVFDDAGAVLLQVNGEKLGAPGRSGQSVERSYGVPEANPR